jgi:predicted permease
MNWFQRFTRAGRMERELDRELRFHIESQIANKIHAGMTEAEARRTTRLEFGGLDQIKEDCRESRGTLWFASIMQDLRFGGRILARSPGFSVTAIVVLALGIGVSTLAFSLYNLIALQSIPVREPATLVRIERRSPGNIAPSVPYASIAYYRDNAKSLSAVVAAMKAEPMAMGDDEQRIHPSFVTSNYFAELGGSAALGRLFAPAREGSSGAAPVVVLSYRFWERRFHGESSVIGKAVYFGGKPATVIGVTSQDFANLGTEDPDVWLPLSQEQYFFEKSKALDDPGFDGMVLMWGRLAPGFTTSQAAQELLSLTGQLRMVYPALIWDKERILVTPGARFFSLEDGAPLLALAAILVLLILGVACANLGGLMMARGVSRQREVQLRIDLGASKLRIFRQLLTESLLLGLLGSMAALPLSYVVLRLALIHADAPAWMSALPDWRVLLFTGAMGFAAAFSFGLLPAMQLSRQKKQKTLWQQLIVCAQVGASSVLLILAGLLVRATLHTMYSDPGFGYEHVLSIDPGLHDNGFTPSTAQAYLDELQSRLRTVPGVISVSMALSPPLVNREVMISGFRVDGQLFKTYPNWVDPEFFETMGIPLLRGRLMRKGETRVVLLSESLARQRWPTEDPIGKEWSTGKDVVVGIVGNTRAMELNNSDATEIYYPTTLDRLPSMSVLVRTAGPPGDVLPAIKEITNAVDPKLFPAITLLKAGYRKSVAQAEQVTTVLSLLGGVAVFLAVVGLLGLIAYTVSQRTKELAIRLSLGASRREIFLAVLRRFLWPTLLGLVAGAGVTAGLSQILRRGLYGISGLDPLSYVGAIALLLGVLGAAVLLPIRRAFHLDIARILHSE